ncbi:Zinc finger, C2H2 type, putative [Angomonas deanei]|uniref:Zinc finger, C2H2 type, putative n=1 Tax=Angomonas deanei TaxID=59799 RepID=A0A7G2CN35_9TRYP|nr:Zinc finger, C2H2 type, putative [Angomonas deanei]
MPRDNSASQPTSPHPQGSTDNEGDRSDSEEESESGSDDSSYSNDFTHRHGRFYTDDPREEVFSKLAKQISTQPDMNDTDGRSDQEKSDHKEYRLEDIPVLHLPCTTAYQCRFCGQYFSFKGTKALHEQKCVRRQLSNVKRRRRRLDNDSATDDNDSPAQLKTVYTCEDCGIEVSAQTKLNRHKKFYCPFRESAFSDPFLDAVGQTSKRSPIPENEIDSNAKVKDFEVLTGLKRQREDSTSDNDEEYEYIYVPTDSEDDGDEDSNEEHHRVKEIYNHDEDELLTKLRLDFKRRRSNNNKLTRRLLRKRLQAHEGLEAPPPPVALPHKKEKNDLLRMVTTGVESSVPKKGVTCPYDGCGKVFSKPSLYHRHVRRVHEK